jgi:hypothetical protein
MQIKEPSPRLKLLNITYGMWFLLRIDLSSAVDLDPDPVGSENICMSWPGSGFVINFRIKIFPQLKIM